VKRQLNLAQWQIRHLAEDALGEQFSPSNCALKGQITLTCPFRAKKIPFHFNPTRHSVCIGLK